VYEFFSAEDVGDGGQEHEDHGDGERDFGAFIFEDEGDEPCRDDGADVDGEIEPAVEAGHEVLVGLSKLVADVCGDAGLDDAGADGDENQTGEKAETRDIEREAEETEAVNDVEDDDGFIFAEPDVGEEGADDCHEVGDGDEDVDPHAALRLGHDIECPAATKQILGHKDGEDAFGTVEGETLEGFVGDDERCGGRHFFSGRRCS